MKRFPSFQVLLLSAFLLHGFVPAYAQKYSFINYGSDEGYPWYQINTIRQDSHGFLWIGGGNILIRFDGIDYKTFSVEDGLPSTGARSLMEDSRQNIWLVSSARGIARYDGESWACYSVAEGLATRFARCLVEDRRGRIWIGTENGIDLYDNGRIGHLESGYGVADFDFISCCRDSSGNIWFGSHADGLYMFDSSGVRGFGMEDGLPDSGITALTVGAQGAIWAGTYNGVARFSEGRWTKFTAPSSPAGQTVRAIVQDRKGVVWVGTENGLFSYNMETWHKYTAAEGIAAINIRALSVDFEGHIWVGTSSGLSKLNNIAVSLYSNRDFFGDRQVITVIEGNEGQMLAGTNRGLWQYREGMWTQAPGIPRSVQKLFKDRDGNIWVVGDRILRLNDKGTIEREIDLAEIADAQLLFTAVTQDSSGTFWFGTARNGLYRSDGKTLERFDTPNAPSNYAYNALFTASNGQVWMGAYGGGLTVYDGVRTKPILPGYGWPSLFINCIHQDNAGNVWVGTEDRGIARYDGENWSGITENDGLANNACYSVMQDNRGWVYIGTASGLSIHDGEKIINLTRIDGLGSDIVRKDACIQDSKGVIWFVTDAGICRLEPEFLDTSAAPPPIYITSSSLIGDSLELAPEARLDHGQGDVEFEFLALTYDAPHQVRYEYMLEGYDNYWLNTHTRLAQYTNLPANNYIFRVRAINRRGEISRVPAEFSFSVAPPFWLTWWFWSLTAIGLVGLVLGGFRYWRQRIIALELRTANDALRDRQELLQTILDNVSSFIVLKDHKGTYLLANRKAEELLGKSLEEITGRNAYDLYPPDIAEKVFQDDMQVLRTKKMMVTEESLLEDSKNLYLTTKVPIFRGGDEPVGLVGMATDITALKEAERSLLESEEKYRKLYNNALVAMFRTALDDGRVLAANLKAAQLYGYSTVGEFIAEFKSVNNYVNLDDRRRLVAELKEKGLVNNYRLQFKRRDGSVFWEELSASINLKEGYIEGVVIDITELKQMEEEREALEERLRQAQKMESIGLLAGGVAHDFNNMLVPIMGYSELVMKRLEPDDPNYSFIQEIFKAGQRSSRFTQQLLAFSRKQVLEIKLLDLNKVITEFGKMLKRLITDNISYKTHLDPKIRLVRADASQIEQILLNLVVNAVDAIVDSGTIAVETQNVYLDQRYVAQHPDAREGEHVMLAVSDTGSGIPAGVIERIFEPFFTTKERGKGTGMGLSMVHGIVKQHGGNIYVYSEPGRGTTFKIYLPAHGEVPEQAEQREARVDSLMGSETILVVEDEAAVRNLIKETLTSNGYNTICAEGPYEAMKIIRKMKQPPELLLTDVMMPGMSGKELYNKLAGDYRQMKVIYMSGYTDNVIAHHGVLEKGIEFLQKPFSAVGLLKKIRGVLG